MHHYNFFKKVPLSSSENLCTILPSEIINLHSTKKLGEKIKAIKEQIDVKNLSSFVILSNPLSNRRHFCGASSEHYLCPCSSGCR
jgi:hypothetical protein